MNLALVFSFFLILTAHAATTEPADIWSNTAGISNCEGFRSEIYGWWKDDGKLDSKLVPAGKIERAIAILDQVHRPSSSDTNQISTALKTNFGDSYLKWLSIAPGDCSQVRLTLVKTLLNTNGSSPEQKAKIHQKVKSTLLANKYPTMLGVSIDALLTEYGLSHGLWKSDNNKTAKIEKLRAELKQSLKKWQDRYGSTFAVFEHDFQDSSPESINRFKKLKELEQIKSGGLEELEISEKFFGELKSLLAQMDEPKLKE